MIQTAAVDIELRLSGAHVVSSFNTLVKPVINQTLSNYIIHLTSIEQHVLDDMGAIIKLHCCSSILFVRMVGCLVTLGVMISKY